MSLVYKATLKMLADEQIQYTETKVGIMTHITFRHGEDLCVMIFNEHLQFIDGFAAQ